jgi:hypothetical protein
MGRLPARAAVRVRHLLGGDVAHEHDAVRAREAANDGRVQQAAQHRRA